MSSSWEAGQLVFRPSERLHPGTRYTISVIGSHDLTGNVIGGKGNFSFIVQPGAQVTKTLPEAGRSRCRARDGRALVQPADGRRRHERGLRLDRHRHRRAGRRQPRLERRRHPAGLHARHRPSPVAASTSSPSTAAPGTPTGTGRGSPRRSPPRPPRRSRSRARRRHVRTAPVVRAGRSGDEPGRLRAEPGQRRHGPPTASRRSCWTPASRRPPRRTRGTRRATATSATPV